LAERLKLHGADHLPRHRSVSFELRPEHRRARTGTHAVGSNPGATTAWPRELTLKRTSRTGW
jgi:hypothetical protein